MGIKDEFHQRNILVCIEELCRPNQNKQEQQSQHVVGSGSLPIAIPDATATGTNLSSHAASINQLKIAGSPGSNQLAMSPRELTCSQQQQLSTTTTENAKLDHHLVPHSFSVLETCDKCHRYLRGLLHQGFLCQSEHHFYIQLLKVFRLHFFYKKGLQEVILRSGEQIFTPQTKPTVWKCFDSFPRITKVNVVGYELPHSWNTCICKAMQVLSDSLQEFKICLRCRC